MRKSKIFSFLAAFLIFAILVKGFIIIGVASHSQESFYQELENQVDFYNQNVDQLPQSIRVIVGDERINGYIKNGKSEVVGIVTENAGIIEFKYGGIDNPTLKVYTDKETIVKIINQPTPELAIAATKDALDDGKIRYEAVGTISQIKTTIFTVFINVYSFLIDLGIITSSEPIDTAETPKPIVTSISLPKETGKPATKQDLVLALKELRDAMNKKIEYEVDDTSLAFASVKDYWNSKRWADIFRVPLRVIEDTMEILAEGKNLKEGGINSALHGTEATYKVATIFLMVNDLQRVGENLQVALDGPTYIGSVEDMLEEADKTTLYPLGFGFDERHYRRVIKNHIYGTGGDSPLFIPRKSTNLERKNIEHVKGALEVRSSINRDLNDLIVDIENSELPEDFPTNEVVAQINDLKTDVKESMVQPEEIRYKTYLNGEEIYVETKLGAISQQYRVFGETAEVLDKKLEIEQRMEVVKLGNAVFYTISYNVPGAEKIKVAQQSFTLTEVIIDSYQNTYYVDPEKQFYSLPQEMLLSMPVEYSNLWMIADDTNHYIRHLLEERKTN